jgi:hypothetical protein
MRHQGDLADSELPIDSLVREILWLGSGLAFEGNRQDLTPAAMCPLVSLTK